jgi:hypothetical protein
MHMHMHMHNVGMVRTWRQHAHVHVHIRSCFHPIEIREGTFILDLVQYGQFKNKQKARWRRTGAALCSVGSRVSSQRAVSSLIPPLPPSPRAPCSSLCVDVGLVCVVCVITREISQASTSTTRGHFGCIFKATADCAT